MVELRKFEDNRLVNMFISGDAEAMDVLVDRYKDRLYSYIIKIVKKQELAEDLFQDTFIKVIKSLKLGKYTENGRFFPWMSRIAHNLIIDHFRREKGNNTYLSGETDKDTFNTLLHSDVPHEKTLISSHVYKQVIELLDELPEEQQEVVRMRFFWGLSFKEIADQTDVSINTALGRMRYAVLNLRKVVEDKKIDLTL